MRCARPAPPRTTRATVRCGSSLSRAVTSLAAAPPAALVGVPASRPAGKHQPCCTRAPGCARGLSCSAPSTIICAVPGGSSTPCCGGGGSPYTWDRRISAILFPFKGLGQHVCLMFAGAGLSRLCFAAAVPGHLRVREVSVSKRHRSFLLASLLPAFLYVSTFAVVQAQNAGSPAARPTNWSDPATWPNGKVPVAGDTVTIAAGKEVVLDVSPPALGGLSIDGKLSFANNRDLELTTEWIMLHGELAIGTEARPHTRKATITLTNSVKDADAGGMGGTNARVDRRILLMRGTLNPHGDRKHTWTKLAQTAAAGSTSIQVLNAAGWRVGDEIVLASTDFDPRQAERRTITAVSGNTLTLDKPLTYMHFGKITFDVDQRGEVGLLTRNIKLQASADAEQAPYFGGHV